MRAMKMTPKSAADAVLRSAGRIVSSVYGAKIMKDLNLIPKNVKIMVSGTVQEEDCDGLCWRYIHKEDKITPEFVVSTEPTDGSIYHGHRGRMEIPSTCWNLLPHKALLRNAAIMPFSKWRMFYRMYVPLMRMTTPESSEIKGSFKDAEPEVQSEHYEDATLLRQRHCHRIGDLHLPAAALLPTAAPYPLTAVAMTAGGIFETCLDEIRNLPSCRKYADDVRISMYNYEDRHIPAWYIDKMLFPDLDQCRSAPHVEALSEVYHAMYGRPHPGTPVP